MVRIEELHVPPEIFGNASGVAPGVRISISANDAQNTLEMWVPSSSEPGLVCTLRGADVVLAPKRRDWRTFQGCNFVGEEFAYEGDEALLRLIKWEIRLFCQNYIFGLALQTWLTSKGYTFCEYQATGYGWEAISQGVDSWHILQFDRNRDDQPWVNIVAVSGSGDAAMLSERADELWEGIEIELSVSNLKSISELHAWLHEMIEA